MDIELARTFLEIVSTGSFIKAADRLHVAQTTVSARVRLLEQQLGRPLFVRNKAGASLTPSVSMPRGAAVIYPKDTAQF